MIDPEYFEGLTKRESEVLQLLADGCVNKKIAKELGITTRTVKFHTANIYEKLKVSSRSGAIAWVWKNQVNLTKS